LISQKPVICYGFKWRWSEIDREWREIYLITQTTKIPLSFYIKKSAILFGSEKTPYSTHCRASRHLPRCRDIRLDK
jgi:hypothetical protein